MRDEEIRYCRTCKRALYIHTPPGGQRAYIHRLGLQLADHEPDPVRLAELPDADIRCDFCSTPSPSWSYLCDNVSVRDREVVGRKVDLSEYRLRNRAARTREHVFSERSLTVHGGERWAACEPCAELIEARQIPALITRVLEVLPARLTRGRRGLVEARASLYQVYEPMFASLLPGRSPITSDDPLGLKATAPGASS